MTLTSACTPRVVITGNSTLGPYSLVDASSVAIRLVSTGHLKLTRFSSTTDATGTLLVLNTDYTVGGTQDARTFTLTSAQDVLTSSQRIVAERVQAYTQDLDLTTGGSFNSSSLESRFDKLAEFQQELKAKVDRAIIASALDTTPSTFPLKVSATSGDLLAFDADKNLTPVTPANIGITSVNLGSGWSTALLLPVPDALSGATITPVATYAAMTALLTATGLQDNGVYYTYGRSAEEDGGAGFWRYDSGSSTTANSGTILAIDGGGAGRFFRLFDTSLPVDARWFGFKTGGGNSDATTNTTALQAALNAYYWVQLPAGTAYINAITHTMTNRLSGAGTATNGTKLVLANSANSRCFIASSRTDMMYEDFIVDMNFANNTGSGAHDAFRLETCTKPVFRNVRVTGAQGLFSGSPVGGGFSLLNGSGARFYDCEATLCFDGLQSTGHTDCVVVGGYYNTNRRFGIVMGTASHRAKFYDVVANGNSTTDSSGGNWSLQDSDDCVAHTLTLNDAVLAFGGLVSGSDRFRGFDITANGNGLDGFGPYDSIDCRVDGFTSSDNAVRGMTIDTSSHMARFTNGYCFGNDDMDVSVFRSANVVVQDANFLTGRVHEAAVAQSAAINAAGSGYTNGTFLCTMDGGTIGPLGRPSFNVTVSGGAVTAVSALINTGEVWTLPTNPVTVTGLAAGSGATFNMTWLGANQQTATKVTFRGGGDGAAMELAVDPLTGGSATSAAIFEGFRGTLTDPSGVAVQAAIGCTNFNVPVRNASLQNSWVVSTRAVYYKDSDGIVHLEGRIASGTVAADTLLFVLPVGFRPANSERFIVDANGSLGRIYVEPDGDVRDLGGTCSAAGTSLNTIRFRAV